MNCNKLTTLILPDSLTYIDISVFARCSSLTKVILPDALTLIGFSSFSYCSSLQYIEIGNNVTVIEHNAFDGCTSLTEIRFRGTVEEWNAIEKENYWNLDMPSCKVICTNGEILIDSYQ